MTRSWVIAACISPLAASGLNPAQATEQDSASPAPRPTSARTPRVSLNVAFSINGAPTGEVPVETDTAGNAAVNVEQLIARLTGVVDRAVIEEIIARAAGRALVPISELQTPRLTLEFSIATLRLAAVIPTEARAVSTLSVVNTVPTLVSTATPPSNLAAGVTVSLGQRFISDGSFNFERQRFSAIFEGFGNIGGADGVYLRTLTGYEEGGSFVRSRTTLFHDDVGRAIRYSAGDIDPQTFGSFAPAASLLGIGVERLYQEIQPYRNLRPSGQGALSLDRPSRVDVLVNGTIYRTLNLAPGRYNLRDFPFLDGLNDVRLVVQDDAGRQESIVVSFFSEATLLEPGLSIFSATLGFPRTQVGPLVNTRYRGEPTFNGFYQRGLSDHLTVGGALQGDRRNGLVSALGVFGTRIGTFGLETSADVSTREAVQWAFVASYRLNIPSATGQLRSLDAQVTYRTARFSPMFEAASFRNPYGWEANIRFQSPITRNLYGTFAAGYSQARLSAPDLWSASVGLSRSFGRIIVSANYVYRNDVQGSDHRAIFSIGIPITARHSARASYDTLRNRARVDYDIQGLEELNSTRARLSLGHNDLGEEGFFEAEHYSNRFRASLRHDYERQSGVTTQTTDAALTFGIGFADGQFALGREAGRGFIIVDEHRTLGDTPILVTSRSTLGPVARTGLLGPALVPLHRGYRPESIQVDIPNLRPGYDIGPGRLDVLPGAASGYRWTIGSAASNLVVGQLVGQDGSPLQFFAGTLQPIEGREARPVPFFTNRTGRMVAQRVAPGRYAIVPTDSSAPIGEVTVPEDATGPVQIGVIRVNGAGR